ncbi:MAG: hypothetical protein FWB85_11745 [Chitinispirillia bacterium]|nr:hypothetical protein [Chitinispirillia bacterium]
MMKTNKPEAEIDRIRVKLYEETKHLTKEEHTRRTNELAHKAAAQYGFTVRSAAGNP